MDLAVLVYNPLYATFGVDAVIRCLYSDAFPIRAIDCTSGIEVTEGSGVDVRTIRPAAVVRLQELNERHWRVKATMPKPAPTGEADGELYLILIEDDA